MDLRMPDFTITSFTTTAQTLTGGEVGVLTNADAELIV
jgi:serralysin